MADTNPTSKQRLIELVDALEAAAEANGHMMGLQDLQAHRQAREAFDAYVALLPDETTGLPVTQEPKYTVRDGRIVTRATGKPIPDDEPVFVLRAKDRNAVYAIMHYRSLCLGNPEHYQAVDSRVGDFLQFAGEHPLRMKYPDTSPGETSPLEPTGYRIIRDRVGTGWAYVLNSEYPHEGFATFEAADAAARSAVVEPTREHMHPNSGAVLPRLNPDGEENPHAPDCTCRACSPKNGTTEQT